MAYFTNIFHIRRRMLTVVCVLLSLGRLAAGDADFNANLALFSSVIPLNIFSTRHSASCNAFPALYN